MSLARIITRNPQDAFAVSEYLRAEGYTVETVSPSEFRITPAEIELDLSRCKKGESLDRAKTLVASKRGVARAQNEAPAASEPSEPQKAKTPVAYDIVGRPVAFADEEEPEGQPGPRSTRNALASALSSLMAPVRELQRWRSERRALKLEAEQERRRDQVLARERARQEMEQRRVEAELGERRRQEQVNAEQQAEQERARAALVRAAGISAARAAAPRKQAEPASAEKLVQQQLPHSRPMPAHPFVASQRPSSIAAGKAVAIGCAAGILVVLGLIANANRRPASPLSPGALMQNTALQQEVPFGPVTITPPAAAPKPSAVVNGRTQPAVRPAHRKPGASRPRTSSQNGSDDVVLRHTQPPSSNPQPTASTASPKQHSNTD